MTHGRLSSSGWPARQDSSGIVTLTLEHVSLTFSKALAMSKRDRDPAYPFDAKP
jgi:hypothetical protein